MPKEKVKRTLHDREYCQEICNRLVQVLIDDRTPSTVGLFCLSQVLASIAYHQNLDKDILPQMLQRHYEEVEKIHKNEKK